MESGSSDEKDLEENPFCIEGSYSQRFTTQLEDSAEDDVEVDGEGNYFKLFLKSDLISFKDACKNCQDTATVYCDQCCNKYCNVCSALRHKHSSRSGHRLIPLSKANASVESTLEITGVQIFKTYLC